MQNSLIHETSPYLLQHAHHPVAWYPWGTEAFERAKKEDKPILLSIGYSACHWCHVMAHECFEDASIAQLMNDHFINIKVDREERPDIDQIYQTVHYMMTERSGGWPLTVFLSPDQIPFFAGTYFPKESTHGLPSFPDILVKLAEFYHTRKEDIAEQKEQIIATFEKLMPEKPVVQLNFKDDILRDAYRSLSGQFDRKYGGFGEAPKFPHPNELDFVLRYMAYSKDRTAQHVANFTLRKMAEGGIYDQVGGGFFRYSVDEYWMIPHFEKMLYDNAQLISLYTDIWRVMQDVRQAALVGDTAQWVIKEMQAPSGGYYATLDADSEGQEGKFYLWDKTEVAQLLTAEEYALFAPVFGLDKPANFEGLWHLHVVREIDEVATEQNLAVMKAEAMINNARRKLYDKRVERVAPHRDEKILTAWNALMIKGMARAGRVFNRPEWVASAKQALTFVREQLWDETTSRLYAVHAQGKSYVLAYLDDYAFLLDALVEIMQTEFRLEDLQFAKEIAEVLLSQFEDTENGGFFFTSHEHEKLIHRDKPSHDSALPAGNAAAILALRRLGIIFGEERYLQASDRGLQLFHQRLIESPMGHSGMLSALEELLVSPRIVIIRGDYLQALKWRQQLVTTYHPSSLVFVIQTELAENLPEIFNKPVGETTQAWVCRRNRCSKPYDDIKALQEKLHFIEPD